LIDFSLPLKRKDMNWRIKTWQPAAFVSIFLAAIAFGKHAAGGVDGAANIEVEPPSFDFAKVEEGVTLKHTFKVSNTGNADLKLDRAYASCGCTTATLSKKLLRPGETAELFVAIDTAMKQDKVAKLVFVSSNDVHKAVVSVRLLMDVQDPHRGMARGGEAKIFTDEHCASCHVARGLGKKGMELFNADCAMCHGPKAEGAVGPTLVGPYSDSAFSNQMIKVTSSGSTAHRSMPGFAKEVGGPLNKEEIDSIVAYLRKLSLARGISK
jgi:mono/diheme cytochrome c family protein